MTGPGLTVPVLLALRDDPAQDVVEPGGREGEVDETGARDLDPLDVRRLLGFECDDDLGRHVAGRQADRLREAHGHVGGEVAVAGLGGRRQLDAALRFGKSCRFQRAAQRGEDLVTDHAEIAGCQTWDSARRIAES